jgi:COP9 signalosome complex subunit 4
MTCIILGKSHPQKTRLIHLFYRDIRYSTVLLMERYIPHTILLEKMYAGELIDGKIVEQFAQTLQPHQLQMDANHQTLLQKAILEHNMQSLSTVYSTITLESLGQRLQIERDMAEKIAAQMIVEDRLQGIIDQEANVLRFVDRNVSSNNSNNSGGVNASSTASTTGQKKNNNNNSKGSNNCDNWIDEEIQRVCGIVSFLLLLLLL